MDLATRKSMRFYRKDGTLNVKSKNLVWANPLMPTNAIEMRIRTVFLVYSSTYIFFFGIFAAGHYLAAKTLGHLWAGSGSTNPCQVSFLLRNSTFCFCRSLNPRFVSLGSGTSPRHLSSVWRLWRPLVMELEPQLETALELNFLSSFRVLSVYL